MHTFNKKGNLLTYFERYPFEICKGKIIFGGNNVLILNNKITILVDVNSVNKEEPHGQVVYEWSLAEYALEKRTGAPILVQWLTNPTRNHEVVGLILGLAQWVNNPALPRAVL